MNLILSDYLPLLYFRLYKMRAQSLGVISTYGLLLLLTWKCSQAIITQEEQEMLDWIRREGGDFKVTISRTSTGVRGVFTTESVRKGDVLIRIPDHLVLSVRNIPAAVRFTF